MTVFRNARVWEASRDAPEDGEVLVEDDRIVVAGNPLDDIGLLDSPGRNLPVIMQDSRLFKNDLA